MKDNLLIPMGEQINTSSKKPNFDLRKEINAYLRRWPWIILSVLFFLVGAWFYTRYLKPVYRANAEVLVEDTDKTGTASMVLGDLSSSRKGNFLKNQILVMTSEKVMKNVVDSLNLNVSYSVEGKVISTEAYKNDVPFLVKSSSPEVSTSFNISVKNNGIFVTLNNGKSFEVFENKPFKINTHFYTLYKSPDFLGDEKTPREYKAYVATVFNTVKSLQNSVAITPVLGTSVIQLSLTGENRFKIMDILDQVVKAYNSDAIKDKSQEFLATANFINDRLKIITKELSAVEDKKESFKKQNEIANVETEVSNSIGNANQAESKLLDTESQLALTNSYLSAISGAGNTILPSNMSSPGVNGSVSAYNELVLKRKTLLEGGATSNHPSVRSIDDQLSSLKSSIVSSVKKERNNLSSIAGRLSSQLGKANSLKRKVPTLEKVTRSIERQQQIKENLYLMLLQKREETAISLAVTSSKAKMLNSPFAGKTPISPNKTNYFLGALALGLILPIGLIFLLELLKNKIEVREDLEDIAPRVPVVGEIPRIQGDEDEKIISDDLSTMSEAFRITRTNVDFVLSQQDLQGKPKVILVTSTIKGEGKTLVSFNFAHILSQVDKNKVVIIGADVRNPQVHRYNKNYSRKDLDGLTEYLVSDDTNYQKYIHKSVLDNKTDIIYSGAIPPNPTELLMSHKFETLIEDLKKEYNYIIIDTAPTLLVSDTFHLNKYCNLVLYVTRSNYTTKSILKHPLKAREEGKLNHLAFIINDISASHSGYGYGYKYNYGYGYGYGNKNNRQSLWQNIKNSFKK